MKDNRLGVVDRFFYLGSTLSRNGSLDAEIFRRIAKASTAFSKLEKRIWSDRDLTTNTKLSVYMRLVTLQSCYIDLKQGQLTGIMLTYSKGFIRFASAES